MNIYSLILFIVLVLLLTLLLWITKKQKKEQLLKIFTIDILLLLLQCLCVFIQSILIKSSSTETVFKIEYITYIANVFLPIALFFTGLIFANTKITFKKRYLLLFVIPILSLLLLWTNKFHHLFYINYSTNYSEIVYGFYLKYVHTLYTYALLLIGIFLLLKYSIKNAGFFSKQSILIMIGALVPIVVNILGSYGIVEMSIFLTPISFAVTIVCFAFAIFKFKFLSVTPIAMQRIVDRMSDSFIVINEDNVITDFNNTFLTNFNLSDSNVRNQNFIDFVKSKKLPNLDIESITQILNKCQTTTDTFLFKKDFKINDKYFNIEVNGIFSKNTFLGSLVLLKDVTQHILDMKTIEDNQSMLMEKECLASLGQMIGGIAHNLKTPIMSIAGATEGLSDLTKEYDSSIGDPEVTNEDHHAIVKDMDEWIKKIREYTEYMSNVITAVKGQAVNFSDETSDSFTINESIKYVDVLMKHELKNALINLNIHMLTDPNITIKGNINSFVQVVNNMISNAIQAYNGQENKSIDFTINKVDDNILFIIQDYGSGIPQKVQDKLFKEMITTKGKNGTGLGLFMSYSNIRAHFNGNITFESKEGEGTKFIISIPTN